MKGKVATVPAAASAAGILPVGFRFRPTDEELVRHYLKAKIAGRTHPDLLLIPDVDLSTCEPWDLPAMSVIKSDDPEWFFFAPRDRKYPGGHRSNRSTAAGYWKATGKDRLIRSRPAGALIGIKKTLVFHRGRAPRGRRTSWIMHEYRTTEPQFESGQNGSFVLYRLFNKQEDDTSGSNLEEPEQQLHSMSPSTTSPGNPQNCTGAVQVGVQVGIASVVKDETLPIQNATDDADQSIAHLLSSFSGKEQTASHDDALMDVFSQLPDLQPEQRCREFPDSTSPIRSYSDHPFVGHMGEQDLSAHFGCTLSEPDLQDLLLSTNYTQMDKYPTGNICSNPTTAITPSNNSNSNALLVDSWRKNDSYPMLLVQNADNTDVTCYPSSTSAPQTETSGANLQARTQSNNGVVQGSHFCNQYQLNSTFNPHMEPQISRAFCSAGSWTPYPQHLFNTTVEPSSGMTFSDAFKEHGQELSPSMQHLTVPDPVDAQQGTAARRIRLVSSVQRASVSQPESTSHLQSEDEGGSCCSTGSSSNNHNEENVSAAFQITDGQLTHIQCKADIPTQVDPSVEVAEKPQGFSFHEEIFPHANRPGGTNLKQRLRLESAHTTQSAQESEGAPGDPSLGTRRQHRWRLFRQALLVMAPLLVLVGVWKSLNHYLV